MADVEPTPFPSTGILPRELTPSLRILSGQAERVPDWKDSTTKFSRLYVVQIDDVSPWSLARTVYQNDIPNITQADLRWYHVQVAIKTGTIVPHDGKREMDLLLSASKPALVVFYLPPSRLAVFEDQNNPTKDDGLVLKSTNSPDLLYQAQRVQGNLELAVSVIMDGNNGPVPLEVAYGLKVKVTTAASVCYIEVDPKIENDGAGGGSPTPLLTAPTPPVPPAP